MDHLYRPRRDRIPQLTIKVMIRQRLKQEEIKYDSKCETFELKKYFMAKPGNRNAMKQYIHMFTCGAIMKESPLDELPFQISIFFLWSEWWWWPPVL